MGLFGPSKQEKYDANFMAPQWLRIATDCAKLVQTTANPDTFFGRLGEWEEVLVNLAGVEKIVKFTGAKPSLILRQFHIDRPKVVEAFLRRYYDSVVGEIAKVKTQKSKLGKAETYKEKVEYYSDKMTPGNTETALCFYRQLVQKLD